MEPRPPADPKKLLAWWMEWEKGELSPDKLRWYVGKRAVGRLGCYGCHDVPGFETAKPIAYWRMNEICSNAGGKADSGGQPRAGGKGERKGNAPCRGRGSAGGRMPSRR